MKSFNGIMWIVSGYLHENGTITADTYNNLKTNWEALSESVSDARECVDKIKELQRKMKSADESEEKEYTEEIRKLSAKFADLKEDIPEDKMKDYEDLEAKLSDLLGKVDDSKKST